MNVLANVTAQFLRNPYCKLMNKKSPFSESEIRDIAKTHPTPFHLYDEKGILDNIARFKKAFSWNPGFREFFAVKATPNPYILKILHEVGLGMDCSSIAELELSERVGIRGEEIMFTSNNTKIEEYIKAIEMGGILNLDDVTQLDYLAKHTSIPDLISFRLNPGDSLAGSSIIGKPVEAKFGVTMEQLPGAYRKAKELGATRFGIHCMPISNQLDYSYFVETASLLLNCVKQLSKELDITFEFINIGGGIGIPYKEGESEIDIEKLGESLKDCFDRELQGSTIKRPDLFMECGRYITGPYGYLVTTAIHQKNIFRDYIGVDASMADLMRPGMYDAYHHISVLGKESAEATKTYDVVGGLCENNDKFAVQRNLPEIEIGDIVVIHDAGAHGHSMGFNYNGKLRSAELLLREDKSVVEIRRAEKLDDLFATLDFTQLSHF